ncbi:MAG: site-specific DNA-methyltransferase, partial [Desulfobacterales bacterium]|nr:site-specific DNA-methyltransferase [Desulfobacterales bacterium]
MRTVAQHTQLSLPGFPVQKAGVNFKTNKKKNKLDPADRGFHDWYRFVLSFPPHLVRKYIEEFELGPAHTILDPFCGTGTTLVESKLNGVQSVGLEANPFPRFASSVKLNWRVDPDLLEKSADQIAKSALSLLRSQGIDDNIPMISDPDDIPLKTLPPETTRLLLKNSISPLPLHKTLVLLDCLDDLEKTPCFDHMLLALANALVFSISNLHFGPEVGVRKIKPDAPVIFPWLSEIKKIAGDIRRISGESHPPAIIHLADAREVGHFIEPASIDAVITSPPYPN